MAVSAPARPPSAVSLSRSRSRPLAQNFLPLKTITFFGRRDPRYSSPARATANRKALAPVVPSSGAMVAGGCCPPPPPGPPPRLAPPAGYGLLDEARSEEHTSELQSRRDLVCRLLLEKKKKKTNVALPIRKKQKAERRTT